MTYKFCLHIVIKKQKWKAFGKGADIKMSKPQISQVVMKGGNPITSLLSVGAKMLPMAT